MTKQPLDNRRGWSCVGKTLFGVDTEKLGEIRKTNAQKHKKKLE